MISDRANVLRFLALLTWHRVELDSLTLFKVLVTVTLNVGEMYEHVVTLLARDETESLFCIEKLHCTLCHENSILRATYRPIRFARYQKLYSPGSKVPAVGPDTLDFPDSAASRRDHLVHPGRIEKSSICVQMARKHPHFTVVKLVE